MLTVHTWKFMKVEYQRCNGQLGPWKTICFLRGQRVWVHSGPSEACGGEWVK